MKRTVTQRLVMTSATLQHSTAMRGKAAQYTLQVLSPFPSLLLFFFCFFFLLYCFICICLELLKSLASHAGREERTQINTAFAGSLRPSLSSTSSTLRMYVPHMCFVLFLARSSILTIRQRGNQLSEHIKGTIGACMSTAFMHLHHDMAAMVQCFTVYQG